MTAASDPRSQRQYRIAFVGTALLLLGIIVTLPFSLASVVDEVLGPATGKVIPLLRVPPAALAPVHSRLHLAVTHIDEIKLLASLRASGHHTCGSACPWRHRLVLVSIGTSDDGAEGLPPSASILLPDTSEAVSETVELPISGVPIRYPFDRYRLVLGIALQRVYPDGRVETLTSDEASRQLQLTIQERLSRRGMSAPVPIDPGDLRPSGDPLTYAAVYALVFEQPVYLKTLAVLLVLLIAAAAAYAVFLRPLEDLLANSGTLVLSVWGVRAILTPGNLFYLTAIDLALSMVLPFLLSGLTVKALIFAHDRGDLQLLRRWPQNPQWGQARRLAHRAADHVRAGDQPEHRQDPRP